MLKVITSPVSEPITVEEAKTQAVIGHDADDTLLEVLISATRDFGEGITNRSLATQTLEVVLDAFPMGKIALPKGPIISIDYVQYVDEDGNGQTLISGTDYDEDTDSLLGGVQPVYGGSWPVAKKAPGSVRVRYTAGFTTCPPAIRQWMLVKVASLYAQRENHIVDISRQTVAEMPRTFVDALLDRYTITEGP